MDSVLEETLALLDRLDSDNSFSLGSRQNLDGDSDSDSDSDSDAESEQEDDSTTASLEGGSTCCSLPPAKAEDGKRSLSLHDVAFEEDDDDEDDSIAERSYGDDPAADDVQATSSSDLLTKFNIDKRQELGMGGSRRRSKGSLSKLLDDSAKSTKRLSIKGLTFRALTQTQPHTFAE